MRRPVDRVRVEASDGRVFDRFTSLEITNDITAPSEASFELGDDGSWASIADFVEPGVEYKVWVNDRLRLSGRVEAQDAPIDAGGGTTIRFLVKTKLADARFASAFPTTRVKDTSIKDFLLALYSPLGYTEADFIFRADVSRDLMTGRSSSADKTVNLDAIKLEQAKVAPPETIFDAAERHLARHGLMHWDAPDGRIVVGAPNDTQDPLYRFRLFRGPGSEANNLLAARRVRNYAGVPSSVWVFGVGGGRSFAKARVAASRVDQDVIDRGFFRPVTIIDEAVTTQAKAEARARREMADRSREKEAWELMTDGWSYWDGTEAIPYGVDTVADVVVGTAGGAVGAYYVHKVKLKRSPEQGDTAELSVLARGVWVL